MRLWPDLALPLATFLAFLPFGWYARSRARRTLGRWFRRLGWRGGEAILEVLKGPWIVAWAWLLGAYIALRLTPLSPRTLSIADRALESLFLISLTVALAQIGARLARFYLSQTSATPTATRLAENSARVAILTVGLLLWLGTLGVSLAPLLLALAVLIIALLLMLQDLLRDLMAGPLVMGGRGLKEGDYIRLDSGEEGQVLQVGWREVRLRSLTGEVVYIPHRRLAQATLTVHPPTPARAREPFTFFTRLPLHELTGLKATTLSELRDCLKQATEAVVYHHTHQFVQRYEYLNPQPPSDFAHWVSQVLGDEELGERLASIDPFDFSSLGALRDRLVDVLTEYLASHPDSRQAPPGLEFHFIKTISFVAPTGYEAWDLREFAEALRKVSMDSLFYHIFEARLRLKKGTNDFSIWLRDNLGEAALAKEIERLNPYTYTMEGLREAILALAEECLRNRHGKAG